MTDFDNNLTGALFKAEKDGNEKRPDYRGSAEIDRVEYWVSAWIRTSKKGEQFMSLKFEPPSRRPRGRREISGRRSLTLMTEFLFRRSWLARLVQAVYRPNGSPKRYATLPVR